ncbi:MAG: hypothetical protein QG666_472, partial [Euryarchaeota archaeon]|nr:hypothetical protein [Euryarchaeota archaeon]
MSSLSCYIVSYDIR